MRVTNGLGVVSRDLSEEDLMECLLIQPGRIGDELLGRERAVQVWKRLIRSRSFISTVIEAPRPVAGHRILGFGASVFVPRHVADAEISNPRPGLNARILGGIDSGRRLTLTEEELRSANTKGQLDLVVLYGSWRRTLTPEAVSEVGASMARQFLELHQGYRMSRIITETVGVEESERNQASHVWRAVRNFAAPDSETRSFWVITQQEALGVAGSVVNALFHHRTPRLRLRDADQQFLIAALPGLTDEELSRKLNVSVGAVKKRWISLFARTLDLWQDLFPDMSDNHGGHKRGRQRRHHLLAYIRSHPEELRPFELSEHPPPSRRL